MTSRLRVALDATPLLGNPTGVGAFCRGAFHALGERSDLDLRAYTVTGRRRHGLEDGRLPADMPSDQRPMVAGLLHPWWRWSAWPPVEWFIGDVDVVHGTNFVVPPTRDAGMVVTVHDLTPVHYPELCSRSSRSFPALVRRALRRGAWVHAVSEFVAAEVVDAFDIGPDRVRAIAHGVPQLPEVSSDLSRQAMATLLPPGTTRFVLAIGTAEPRKDLPGLVRAFDHVAADQADLALVLAGSPGWREAELTAAIEGAHAGARVVRTGWVDDAILAALLNRASVLAYPSLYEGFGFPPLQAMAAGVPVVATRAGALPEVLGDAAFMTDVGDHEGLADALQLVLNDDGIRERLVRAGQARAASYSWERCGEDLSRLYRDVALARGA